MAETTTHPAICRICSAHCGVIATVTDGRLTKVTGDPDNPMFKGYTCAKGRALPAIHNNPERLLSSQKRGADGTFAPIEAQQAMDEIAAKLAVVDRPSTGRARWPCIWAPTVCPIRRRP